MSPTTGATTCADAVEQHRWFGTQGSFTMSSSSAKPHSTQPVTEIGGFRPGWKCHINPVPCRRECATHRADQSFGQLRCILPSRHQLHAWRHRQSVWDNRKHKFKQSDESYLFKQDSGFALWWHFQQTAIHHGIFPFLLARQTVPNLLSCTGQQNLHLHPQCYSGKSRAAGQLLLGDLERAGVRKTLT